MPGAEVSLNVPAELGYLEEIQAFVGGHAEAAGAPMELCPKLELVIEELFANIVNHAHPRSKDDVEFCCSYDDDKKSGERMLCFSLRDWGPPFNPLKKEPPALEQEVEARPIGGLGIHLVLKMANRCSYERQQECNLVTVCFKLS